MKNYIAAGLLAMLLIGCSSPVYLSKTPTDCVKEDTLIIKASGQHFQYYYCDTNHADIKRWILKQVR